MNRHVWRRARAYAVWTSHVEFYVTWCAPKWRRLHFRGKIKVLKNSLKLNLGYNSVSNYQFAKLIGRMSVNKWPVLWKYCNHEHLIPGEWRDGLIVVDGLHSNTKRHSCASECCLFYKPFWAEFNRIDSDFGDLFCDVGHTLLMPRICWVFDKKRSLYQFSLPKEK